jgi:transposase
LYLSPPEHAVVLSLAARPGVLDLYAALEVATGKLTHALKKSRTRADLLSFLKKVERAYSGEELHVILDNSSSHGTPELREWQAEYPSVCFHYTPTRASWLNQVEGFIDVLGKQSLPGTDRSKKALREHLRAYLRAWNQSSTPFEWTKPTRPVIK